jgi:hypothetical protein
MGRETRIPIILLTIGLVALGIVAAIQQGVEDGFNGLPGITIAVLVVTSFFTFLLVLVSTQALLPTVLPTPAYRTMSQREGLLGGILLGVPLVIGFINFCVGDVERSPLFFLLFPLNVVGVSGAFWFLITCIGHLLAQDRSVLFKVFWVVVLILGNLVAMPVYWFIFVWRPFIALPSRSENNTGHP